MDLKPVLRSAKVLRSESVKESQSERVSLLDLVTEVVLSSLPRAFESQSHSEHESKF